MVRSFSSPLVSLISLVVLEGGRKLGLRCRSLRRSGLHHRGSVIGDDLAGHVRGAGMRYLFGSGRVEDVRCASKHLHSCSYEKRVVVRADTGVVRSDQALDKLRPID
jgi:hypothetical protein